VIRAARLWRLDEKEKENNFQIYPASGIGYLVSLRLPGPFRPGTGKQCDVSSIKLAV
jgi:hypothetical protein